MIISILLLYRFTLTITGVLANRFQPSQYSRSHFPWWIFPHSLAGQPVSLPIVQELLASLAIGCPLGIVAPLHRLLHLTAGLPPVDVKVETGHHM